MKTKNFFPAQKYSAALALSIFVMLSYASCSTTQNGVSNEAIQERFIFELSENVTRTSVTFTNRFGITLSGDLYTARDLDTSITHPALVVGPPYGGVKEQGPGVYANQLAQRGFVVLAFDPSFNGASGGYPRHVSSPDIFTEDFSAGVDFLGTLPFVDRNGTRASPPRPSRIYNNKRSLFR